MTEGRLVPLFRLCLARLHRISSPFISSVHCLSSKTTFTHRPLHLSLPSPFRFPLSVHKTPIPLPSFLPSFPPSPSKDFSSPLPSISDTHSIQYIHTLIHCRSISTHLSKTLFHHYLHRTNEPTTPHLPPFWLSHQRGFKTQPRRYNSIQYSINHAHRNTRSVTARQPAQERQAHPHLHCPWSGRHVAVDRDCVFLASASQASTGQGGVGLDFGGGSYCGRKIVRGVVERVFARWWSWGIS